MRRLAKKRPGKLIQNIQVAGVTIKVDDPHVMVDTDKITKQQWKWDGKLIQIRPLKNGKSQIIRLA